QTQINKTQSNTLAQFPITISQTAQDTNTTGPQNDKKTTKSKKVVAKISDADKSVHQNKITKGYLKYVKNINHDLSKNITYTYATGMNLLRRTNGKTKTVSFSNTDSSSNNSGSAMSAAMASSTGVGGSVYPSASDGGTNFLKKHYKVLAGSYPKSANDVILLVDRDNS